MAVKVTGLYKAPSGIIFENPLLVLQPKLFYKGILNIEVLVVFFNNDINNYDLSRVVHYFNLPDIGDTDILSYGDKINSYSDLITACESYFIQNQQNSNTVNSQSVFENYTPE